jgi:predicted neuraminidase
MKVADGIQSDGSRQPCWNPVLFRPAGGPLMLFYKVGPSPSTWWGMVKTSDDEGLTWGDAARLPDGILGPIKNKPVQLPSGEILSPSSTEGEGGWRVHFERSADGGKTWSATPPVASSHGIGGIQPSILIHSATELQAIGRTRSSRLFETWSNDAGRSWSPLALTPLPNPSSGTDAVTLQDGRHLLVYNHSAVKKVRYPLNIAISEDGKDWLAGPTLEDEPIGQYSYPAAICGQDGLVHVAYTWRRLRMKYAALDPRCVELRPLPPFAEPVVAAAAAVHEAEDQG